MLRDINKYYSWIMRISFAISCVLISLFTQAQDVNLKLTSDDLKELQTYLVIEDLNANLVSYVGGGWFKPETIHSANSKEIASQMKEANNVFIIPVSDFVEKGVSNHKLIVCRGKSTNVLPKAKDEFGFYEGATSLDVIASVYVDPKKVKTEFLRCYVSALANLMRNAPQFENAGQMAEKLKKGFWYPELKEVHFEVADLDSAIQKKDVMLSLWSKAKMVQKENLAALLKAPDADILFADIMEIKLKGGKTEIHKFFFSPMKGLVYHQAESTTTRKDKKFNKRDIYDYGNVDSNGK